MTLISSIVPRSYRMHAMQVTSVSAFVLSACATPMPAQPALACRTTAIAPVRLTLPPGAAKIAELPACALDLPQWPAARRTIRVPAGQSVQAAVNSAQPGDEIVLDAGATYRGAIVLPRKTGQGWITIRTSNMAALPPAGTRVRPMHASAMARLVPGHPSESVVRTVDGAARWRLVGLEITYPADVREASTLVSLGSADLGEQRTLAAVAADLVLERVYVHGTPQTSFRRCIALNSARTIIVDSHISDCHGTATQSQAIGGWNGPGPYRIENNYIEASSQPVFFGGSDPSIRDLVPSDIEIRRNHFFVPRAWAGKWVIFAQLEFKNAARVLVEGNVFDYEGHQNFSQLWKSVNQDGGAPWSVTKDVTFRYNVIRGAGSGINVAGRPESQPAIPAHRITIVHNVVETVGRINVMLADADDVLLASNSFTGGDMGVVLNGRPMQRLTILRNTFDATGQQFRSDEGLGNVALQHHAARGFTIDGNVFFGGDERNLPPGSVTPPRGSLPGRAGANRMAVDSATRGVVLR